MGILEPHHLVVILIVALLIFGPGKISELGGSFGKAIKDFKKAVKGEDPDAKTPPQPSQTSGGNGPGQA